jgi:peptide/nickel transport system permease protein
LSYVEAMTLSPQARRRRIYGRRFVRRPAAVVSLLIVVGAILAALLARWVAPYSPDETDFNAILASPSREHLLGTDDLGRDTFSRIVWGARASIQAGFLATVLAMVVAVPIGLIAGYYRGWFDDVVMRIVDLQMSVPSLLIALLVLYLAGPSFINIVVVLAVTRWMVYARVSRGLMLSLREVLFVEASRALGASNLRIIVRHLLPNLLAPILVLATLELAVMMLTEASLSFLGLGIQPPESSWGLMLAEGREYLTSAPWLVAVPGLAILFTTLSVNIIATWLRSRSTQATYARAASAKEGTQSASV